MRAETVLLNNFNFWHTVDMRCVSDDWQMRRWMCLAHSQVLSDYHSLLSAPRECHQASHRMWAPSTQEQQGRVELLLVAHVGLPSGPCAVYYPGRSHKQLEVWWGWCPFQQLSTLTFSRLKEYLLDLLKNTSACAQPTETLIDWAFVLFNNSPSWSQYAAMDENDWSGPIFQGMKGKHRGERN